MYIRYQVCTSHQILLYTRVPQFHNAPLGVGISTDIVISVLFLHMCVVLLLAVYARLFKCFGCSWCYATWITDPYNIFA